MILTVTPNPMLDKILWLDELRFGATHRAQRMGMIAGGKGINVARALTGLGENTLATGFLGGPTGAAIRALLERENIPHDFIETAAATRTGFTLVEVESGRRTAVFEPGSQLQAGEVEALIRRVEQLLPGCRALALCGSMPCAGFDRLYADLLRLAHVWRIPVFLDSYLAPLKAGLEAQPQFLKPNREEALQTFGLDARAPGGMQKLLHLLSSSGAQCIFVTDAARPLGVMLNGKQYSTVPPKIASPNPLGGGDALVAGFLYAWLHGIRELELLRFAVAAGTVNAMHDTPGYADLEEIKACMERVQIEALS
ncbi:MAG: 1-phosphofructokinase family hexose kinase [bacterium]